MPLSGIRKATLLLGAIFLGLIAGSTLMGIPPVNSQPNLGFPIQETNRITRITAFHTPDWGEPGVYHNGIDLVVSDNVTILSPISGTVIAVGEQENTYADNMLFEVSIAVNWFWSVKLVLEPDSAADSINNGQRENIVVQPFSKVSKGETVGTLILGGSYTHLHYMLMYMGLEVSAYDYSDAAAQSIFEEIAEDSNSTIQYDYSEPIILTSPLGIALLAYGSIMIVLVILSYKKK